MTKNQENEMTQIVSVISDITDVKPDEVVSRLNEIEASEDSETMELVGNALNSILTGEGDQEESANILIKVFKKPSEMFKEGGKLNFLVEKFQNGGMTRREARKEAEENRGFSGKDFRKATRESKKYFRENGLRGSQLRQASRKYVSAERPEPQRIVLKSAPSTEVEMAPDTNSISIPIMSQDELVRKRADNGIYGPEWNFKGAFRDARNTGHKEFIWRGKRYNTNLGNSINPAIVIADRKPKVTPTELLEPDIQPSVVIAERHDPQWDARNAQKAKTDAWYQYMYERNQYDTKNHNYRDNQDSAAYMHWMWDDFNNNAWDVINNKINEDYVMSSPSRNALNYYRNAGEFKHGALPGSKDYYSYGIDPSKRLFYREDNEKAANSMAGGIPATSKLQSGLGTVMGGLTTIPAIEMVATETLPAVGSAIKKGASKVADKTKEIFSKKYWDQVAYDFSKAMEPNTGSLYGGGNYVFPFYKNGGSLKLKKLQGGGSNSGFIPREKKPSGLQGIMWQPRFYDRWDGVKGGFTEYITGKAPEDTVRIVQGPTTNFEQISSPDGTQKYNVYTEDWSTKFNNRTVPDKIKSMFVEIGKRYRDPEEGDNKKSTFRQLHPGITNY